MLSDALEPGVTPPGATSAGAFADSTLQHHVSAAAKLEHVAALVDVVGERGCIPSRPVSIAVARRSRHIRLASRRTSSRSTAV